MRKIVIFGTGDMGLLTYLSLREDSHREVAAFTVERSHMAAKRFCDAEVVPFDEVSTAYPPASCEMLIAVGPDRQNRLRERLFAAAASMGYDFATYIHSSVQVHSSTSIGRNCLIYENVVLQPYARLADNVMVRPLSYIGHHVSIGAHSFVAPNVNLLGRCTLGERTFIGAGAVVGPSVDVGANATIGANASVLRAVPAGTFVAPNSVAR